MSYFKAKMHQIRVPAGEHTAVPRPPIAVFRRAYFRGRRRKEEGRESNGEGREEEVVETSVMESGSPQWSRGGEEGKEGFGLGLPEALFHFKHRDEIK